MSIVVNGKEYANEIEALNDFSRDIDDPSALADHIRPWIEIPVEENPMCRFRLRHPFCYSVIGPLLPHQCNHTVAVKWETLKEAWRERNWDRVIGLHERPYRMGVLEKLYLTGRISVDELRSMLVDWWSDTEIPQSNQDEPLALFYEAGFSTDDQEGFDALPAVLTLYRGVDGVCELTPDGPSWTTERNVADFFAKRYAKGVTYRIEVERKSPAVLAWISGRGETEIILDFSNPCVLDSGSIEVEADFREEK